MFHCVISHSSHARICVQPRRPYHSTLLSSSLLLSSALRLASFSPLVPLRRGFPQTSAVGGGIFKENRVGQPSPALSLSLSLSLVPFAPPRLQTPRRRRRSFPPTPPYRSFARFFTFLIFFLSLSGRREPSLPPLFLRRLILADAGSFLFFLPLSPPSLPLLPYSLFISFRVLPRVYIHIRRLPLFLSFSNFVRAALQRKFTQPLLSASFLAPRALAFVGESAPRTSPKRMKERESEGRSRGWFNTARAAPPPSWRSRVGVSISVHFSLSLSHPPSSLLCSLICRRRRGREGSKMFSERRRARCLCTIFFGRHEPYIYKYMYAAVVWK